MTTPRFLGRQIPDFHEPSASILDPVANPNPDVSYLTRFVCPEFTSLCPVTGQPDFAHIVIDYVPAASLIESKSLKLYLHAYRNYGAFHEGCTVQIGKDIVATAEPVWLRISAFWYPRGGIPIDVFWQTGSPPDGVFVPESGVSPYRGRG